MTAIDVLLAVTLAVAVVLPLLRIARDYQAAAADPWVELAKRSRPEQEARR